MDLRYKTIKMSDPKGKPKVWFSCHPDDFGEVFPLLSDDLLDRGQVMHDESSTLWEGSAAQQWCTDFAAAAFTPEESALIPATSKDEKEAFLYVYLNDSFFEEHITCDSPLSDVDVDLAADALIYANIGR